MGEYDFSEILNSDCYKDSLERSKEKAKDVNHNPNALHIAYYSIFVSRDEIRAFENDLKKVNLELSSYDRTGDITASFDLFQLDTFIQLSSSFYESIISGLITNSIWDIIKTIISKLNETLPTKSKEEISLGIKIKLDKHKEFDFDFKGSDDSKSLALMIKELTPFLQQEQIINPLEISEYAYFDKKMGKWVQVNQKEEFKKKHKEQRKKKKK